MFQFADFASFYYFSGHLTAFRPTVVLRDPTSTYPADFPTTRKKTSASDTTRSRASAILNNSSIRSSSHSISSNITINRSNTSNLNRPPRT